MWRVREVRVGVYNLLLHLFAKCNFAEVLARRQLSPNPLRRRVEEHLLTQWSPLARSSSWSLSSAARFMLH